VIEVFLDRFVVGDLGVGADAIAQELLGRLRPLRRSRADSVVQGGIVKRGLAMVLRPPEGAIAKSCALDDATLEFGLNT
jgi:hypothetical protein